MKVIAIIPARYASTRFPGKPLVNILGKPMIQWVYERTKAAPELSQVLVATDDNRIFEAVRQFGGQAVMTSADHQSGTERIVEASRGLTGCGKTLTSRFLGDVGASRLGHG